MMGAERRSMVMSEDEKKLTAYHEAGHAVATIHSPASDPIHKATIIPKRKSAWYGFEVARKRSTFNEKR